MTSNGKNKKKGTIITSDIVKVKVNMWTGLYTIIFENKQFIQALNPTEYIERLNKFFETATSYIEGLNFVFVKREMLSNEC